MPWTRDEMAARAARELEDGFYVNLGIGLPTLVANYIPEGVNVMLQSENGLLGMGPALSARERDSELTNAGKEYVTLIKGGSFFHHGDSFAMMRGGHLDLCVLGAFQVAANGDLANWHTGAADAIPAVGGAMDLAVGAKEVYVTMEHTTKTGAPKIVETCRYPLTGMACVNRIYTDLAVIDITPQGLLVREMVEGLDLAELQNHTEAKLQDGR